MKKPEHCQQDWLSMKPTEGGRICGKCEKKIIDFSGMSWAEIMRVQEMNGFAACGMYSNKQLKHWGGEVPKGRAERWGRAALVAAAMSLATAGMGQTPSSDAGSTGSMIRGTVMGPVDGPMEPILGAQVRVVNTQWGALTDLDGKFSLHIPLTPEQIKTCTLEVSYIGLETQTIALNEVWDTRKTPEPKPLKIVLEDGTDNLIVFYVKEPTRKERRQWRREEKERQEGEG